MGPTDFRGVASLRDIRATSKLEVADTLKVIEVEDKNSREDGVFSSQRRPYHHICTDMRKLPIYTDRRRTLSPSRQTMR
jgi:hypothetical protein